MLQIDVAVALEAQVDERLDRRDARGARRGRPASPPACSRSGPGPAGRTNSIVGSEGRRLGARPSATSRARRSGSREHARAAPASGSACELPPGRRAVARRPVGQAEEDADAAGGRLRAHQRPERVLLLGEVDRPASTGRGGGCDWVSPKRHRAAGAAADLAHHGHLGPGVGRASSSSRSPRRIAPSNTPRPVRPQHVAEGEQLVGRGERARHRAAVGHTVHRASATGRDAERAGAASPRRPARPSWRCRRPCRTLVQARSPIAATRTAQWPTMPPTLMPLGDAVEPAEVLAVGRPVPRQAVEDRLAGDVLDALHHLGQELALARADRRERHAAVAEHHAGDAVPARRRRQRVPGQLGVEVGVDVDEAGRDDLAVGVDLARRRARRAIGSTATIRSPAMATSARRAGAAGPVDDHAVADDEIGHEHPRASCRRACSLPAPSRVTPNARGRGP